MWAGKETKIVAAPLGFYAVVENYWQSRRETVDEARQDLDRALNMLQHSTTPLVWLAI